MVEGVGDRPLTCTVGASLEGRICEEVGETKAVVEGFEKVSACHCFVVSMGWKGKPREGGGTALTSLREGRRHAAACLRSP